MASLFKRVVAQINPFDKGATYNNPTPQRKPAPAAQQQQQTQQGPRVNAQQLQAAMQRQPLQVTVAQPQLLQMGGQIFAPSPNARTSVQLPTQKGFNAVSFAKDIAQQIARSPVNIGISAVDPFMKGRQVYNPSGNTAAIFGKAPVTSYQERQRGLQAAIEGKGLVKNKGAGTYVATGLRQKLAAPLSIAGTVLNAAGDVTAVVPAGAVGKTVVKQGAKQAVKGAEKAGAKIATAAEALPQPVPLNQAGFAKVPGIPEPTPKPKVVANKSVKINEKAFNNATANDNAKIAEFNRIRKTSGSDQNLYDTLLNYTGDSQWLKSARNYISREHDAKGIPLNDVLNEIGTPLPSYKSTIAANLSDSHQVLSKSIRELGVSTGQPDLYKNVATAMKGMNEKEQVKFMNDA